MNDDPIPPPPLVQHAVTLPAEAGSAPSLPQPDLTGSKKFAPPATVAESHSRLGIASFAISLAVGLLLLLLFVVAGFLNSGRIQHSGPYPGQTAVGILAIMLLAADIVAIGLGIASVCQSAKKRVFGILGLTFSSLTLVGGVALIIIGILFAASLSR
jgi:hypothetical protein